IVLSVLGGIIGILLGQTVAILGTRFVPNLNLSVQPDSVVLATVVSITIGIFFGLYPAWQAARKNPIDALRSE
ncbi:MAG: FtsX-like permease family protein, partial [Chloroflexota bacterium]